MMHASKLRLALVLFVIAFAASTARAQVGAYVNFTAQHIDSSARNINDTAGKLPPPIVKLKPSYPPPPPSKRSR